MRHLPPAESGAFPFSCPPLRRKVWNRQNRIAGYGKRRKKRCDPATESDCKRVGAPGLWFPQWVDCRLESPLAEAPELNEVLAKARAARNAAIQRQNRIVKESAPQGDGFRSGWIGGWNHPGRKPQRNFDLHWLADRHQGRGRLILAAKHQPRGDDGDEDHQKQFA